MHPHRDKYFLRSRRGTYIWRKTNFRSRAMIPKGFFHVYTCFLQKGLPILFFFFVRCKVFHDSRTRYSFCRSKIIFFGTKGSSPYGLNGRRYLIEVQVCIEDAFAVSLASGSAFTKAVPDRRWSAWLLMGRTLGTRPLL